jgi:hypothetical protein
MKTLKRFAAVIAAATLTVGMSVNCFAAAEWGHYFGMDEKCGSVWYEGAECDGEPTVSADGWTAKLKTIGWGGVWGAQMFQETGKNGTVDIKKGQEYNLKCTLKSSNCDKWVYIKIAKGEGKENLAFAKWVFIKKGSSVTVDETFTANANANSIYFGFGGENGDRQNSDKDAELRYSYIPGGLTALTETHKDAGGDFEAATTVSCSGYYLGPVTSNESETTAGTGTTSTTTTTTVATGDFTPIACGAAAVIAAAVIVVFARKRETR